ncbi:MAG: hypothetical protein EBR82_07340 [Caulobacteraceae bacterium]|nr:hypothetical protein [Caulobacteraceae bacterium]
MTTITGQTFNRDNVPYGIMIAQPDTHFKDCEFRDIYLILPPGCSVEDSVVVHGSVLDTTAGVGYGGGEPAV